MRPAMILSSVVLPQPLGPSTTMVLPSGTRSVRSSMAKDAAAPASRSVLPTETRSMRAMRAPLSADQAVESPGVVTRDHPRDLGRQLLELLADVLLRLRPDPVGVRIVRPPHQRLRAHLVDELGADAVVLEGGLALAPPVLARQHLQRQVLVLVLVL